MQKRAELAKKVRGYRVFSELGVEAAATAAGKSRSWWSNIEAGRPPIPPADNLSTMARVIGAPKHELLRIAGYESEAEVAEEAIKQQAVPGIAEVLETLQELLEVQRRLDAGLAQLSGPVLAPPLPAQHASRQAEPSTRPVDAQS